MKASIADTSRDELQTLRDEVVNGNVFPKKVRESLPSLSLEEFEVQARNGAQFIIEMECSEFLENKGVTCFSETNDNLLMWSHYGGQYKGYCLEFRTEYEPFNKLRKVRYTAEMPQFQLADFLGDTHYERLIDLFCTKSSAWAYEVEWRVLHEKAGTMYSYERDALKAIYFGPDIDEQDRDLLCLILHCQYPDAEMWMGERSDTAFAVQFEQVTDYLPYAEARRQGLT